MREIIFDCVGIALDLVIIVLLVISLKRDLDKR